MKIGSAISARRRSLSHLGACCSALCLTTLSLSHLPLVAGFAIPAGSQIPGNQGDANSLGQVTIGTSPGLLISPNFMGVAHEWGDAQAIMGSSANGVNNIYRQLLSNLTAYGSGPIIVRIGGNSTDTSKEPTSATVEPFAELASAIGAHFYLGVNLGAANVQLAVDQAKAFVAGMPADSLDAIEIGNEPDSYVDKGMRSVSYPFPAYLSEFDSWRQRISPLLPSGAGLLGPSWAYPASLSNAAPFLEAEHSYLYALSQHVYVGDACKGHVNPADKLLRPGSASGAPSRMRDAASLAHGYHVPFRVDELNSIACGGQDGVSNVFGSALWAIDIMFEFANAGVDGVNWQSPNGAAYSPLIFNIAHAGGNRIYQLSNVSPLYYGMLLFQAATGKEARLLPVSLNSVANMKAWATMEATGKIRLVLINKEPSSSGKVLVRLPGFRSATLLRLTAPDLASKRGVTFAGQTMDGSSDGTLQGAKHVETLNAADDAFQIFLPAGSALIAEFLR
jgi:hypothetical protein